MASTVDTTQLTGNFKVRYADRIEDLRNVDTLFLDDVPFVAANQREGDSWVQPVLLAYSHGFTYATGSDGAFALNTPIALTMGKATVNGYTIVGEERISMDAAARASNGGSAFAEAFDITVMSLTDSHTKRKELNCLYGTLGIGRMDPTEPTVSGTGTTTQVCQLDTAFWATGIWSGMETCEIDVYSTSSGVPTTLRNSNATIVVTKVDVANRRITVTGNATDLDAIAVNDSILFRSSKTKLPTGFITQASNTGSLFGIDGATYSLWQGNTYAVGSLALTMDKVFSAFDGIAGRCKMGEWILYVNPRTFNNLAQDFAALRRLDSSYSEKQAANGVESIRFATQVGSVTLKPHKMMWESYALAYNKKYAKRVGAVDLTFKIPGRSDDMFYLLPSNNGYGFRSMSLEAPVLINPASALVFTGITNG